jgi:lipoprotein-anchoring transpeptidase ErfK/SrfK
MIKFFLLNILMLSLSIEASPYIEIDITQQRLYLKNNNVVTSSYPISSSAYGEGQVENSLQTPYGKHSIKIKIGTNVPKYHFFNSRQHVPQEARVIHDPMDTKDDFITSRIMWLEGTEDGFNRGGAVDSFKRYIYIHGTHEEGLIGSKASHGCIRMFNHDVIELFELVSVDTPVIIL